MESFATQRLYQLLVVACSIITITVMNPGKKKKGCGNTLRHAKAEGENLISAENMLSRLSLSLRQSFLV